MYWLVLKRITPVVSAALVEMGVKKGDLVAFIETKDGVLISRREVVAMEALDRIGMALKERGINLDELIESGREIRGQIVEEKPGARTERE